MKSTKNAKTALIYFVRRILFFTLLGTSGAFAHNKVVVVPLLGGESSHEHADMEYISLSNSAFQPKFGADGYDHPNGLLTIAGSSDQGVYTIFIANLLVPNGVTLRQMSAIYKDGDTARDVLVQLYISSYSDNVVRVLAVLESTGLSFGAPFSRRTQTIIPLVDGEHPVDNMNNGYSVRVFMRNGAAFRGVTIGYTTAVD